MEEKAVITLNHKQLLELEEIIIDKDKEAAFRFLKKNIYKPIKKPRESGCKPEF